VENPIRFEHPLNERCRLLLRIECIFSRIQYYLPSTTAWEAQATIAGLVEAANLFNRSDIKSEVIKELKRIISALSRIGPHPGLDEDQLAETIGKLEQADNNLNRQMRQIGRHLHDDDFFKSIMQRSSIPGGTCAFDLPQYFLWLNLSPKLVKRDLLTWFDQFQPIIDSVQLLLSIYRDSCESTKETAEKGFFLKNLNTAQPTQLVIIELEPELRVFPEVSGDRHRFNIRFRRRSEERTTPETYKDRLSFRLAISAI